MDAQCPRCGKWYGFREAAVSRTDNKTKVCNLCGMAEAVEVAYGRLLPKEHWSNGK